MQIARFPLRYRPFIGALTLYMAATATGADTSWVTTEWKKGALPLVRDGRAAAIVCDPSDHRVVALAAQDLAADIERVTGARPAQVFSANYLGRAPFVLVGTLGRSSIIDGLVERGKIDARRVAGRWETFLITTVARPFPGVERALVIAGSDRRGTAFGVYELSQAVGVSPWHFWSDVAPAHKDALFVTSGTRVYGPPSVKYRGIFINDEDWGLKPWAARTFDPELGDIGPKTYRRVFELLLRLKANTLWPAMHGCSRPFNADGANARLADDYAIVMGSSHAEPMLRNNVREWTAPPEDYNYLTNRAGVVSYWEERVRTNGRFENIYTLGMRGIHDSNMQGPKTKEERIATLERIFADQRALLAKHVAPAGESAPQMFCAYKEVLELYRAGLKVPDDVTIVWPDDNFGYIRDFATPAERTRKGGFGVYYHISYLGRPLAYLWLHTTPPALIWEEMSKAYEHGADRIWIVNVGDIKPAEIGTELFLQMAWDIGLWRRDNVTDFLAEWACREFGASESEVIAALMRDHFALNFQRKPEHLQWWLPGEVPRTSPLSPREINERLDAFARLEQQAARIEATLPAERRDAFYQLVTYPVRGSALANLRYFAAEEYARLFNTSPATARAWAERARGADARLDEETRYFNERLAGGKWRHMMALEPADNQWRSMRIASMILPAENMAEAKDVGDSGLSEGEEPATVPGVLAIEAEHFNARRERPDVSWGIIPSLGRSGDSVAIFPTTAPSVETTRLASDAPWLSYSVDFEAGGEHMLTAFLLPTHPLVAGRGLRFAVGIDNEAPHVVVADVKDGSPTWAQGVLNAALTASTTINVPMAGRHALRIYMVDAGVVLDKLMLHMVPLPPSYLGPPDSGPVKGAWRMSAR